MEMESFVPQIRCAADEPPSKASPPWEHNKIQNRVRTITDNKLSAVTVKAMK